MTSVRAPKWDWESHLPKMMELYDLRMSIPDIHDAIQCKNFEPSLSSVYSKFRSLGCPTDPVGRTKLLDAKFPRSSNGQAGDFCQVIMFDELANHQSPNLYSNQSSPLPQGPILERPTEPWTYGGEMSSPLVGQAFEHINLDAQLREEQKMKGDLCTNMSIDSVDFHTLEPEIHPGTPWQPPNDNIVCEDWDFDHAFEFRDWPTKLNGAPYFDQNSAASNPVGVQHGNRHEFGPGIKFHSDARSYLTGFPPLSGTQVHESIMFSHQGNGQFLSNDSFESHIDPSSTTHSTNSIQKIRSWFRPKSSDSSRATKRYAKSQITTQTGDSGYASGFTSRITFQDVPNVHPRSLEEFNGLYRVACGSLHEPQGKAQWKDIPTCSYCRYSSIHNLGWSARYLKFEVFSSELKLNQVYDLGAIDAAGNTALHYAAAGGSGLNHLRALIDAGVDPYAANTAGELFIYCLRPLQPFTLEPNSDCFDGDDLIHLLGLLQPQLAFDWRDNNGQTIMHALALKMTEPDLKAKVFKIFNDAGYPSTVLDRFGRTAEDVVPLTYDSHGQVIDLNRGKSFHDADKIFDQTEEAIACNRLFDDERPLQQLKAHNIIAKAHQQPRYVDRETGDNVVHAISRLKSRHDVLENLDCFILKDVDLNLHNREGKHPLISFISDRPQEESETGATMSKFLDAILWKNIKERLSNKINVNMKDRKGATALHYATVRGRPDSTRSLIEAGANVNARLDNGLSILSATFDALNGAIMHSDNVLVHLFKEVISHLEHAGAVQDPTSLQERGINKL